jgi:hypothetical protein
MRTDCDLEISCVKCEEIMRAYYVVKETLKLTIAVENCQNCIEKIASIVFQEGYDACKNEGE